MSEQSREQIRDLAMWLHYRYNDLSKICGWSVKEDCQVVWNDLPEKNKCVMLKLASNILEREKGIRYDERKKILKEVIALIQRKTSRRKWTPKEANYVTEYRQTIYKILMKELKKRKKKEAGGK